jgi:hypothetical protein
MEFLSTVHETRASLISESFGLVKVFDRQELADQIIHLGIDNLR